MSTIIASHIPTSITHAKIEDFFGFCGTIQKITPVDKTDKTQSFEIQFTSAKALSTALLLNDAELDGVPIKVEELKTSATSAARPSVVEEPPTYAEAAPGATGLGDHKVQDSTKTGDTTYDDISQEEKPKLAILAQLLAQGYQLSDNLIEKLIQFDQEKGVSTKFKSFLLSLDEKYLHSQEPESTANKNLNKVQDKFASLTQSFQGSLYLQKLQHYYEKAQNHPYGVKVHDFYKNLARDVTDVHNEAKRLNALKREKELESSESTASAAAAINTAN